MIMDLQRTSGYEIANSNKRSHMVISYVCLQIVDKRILEWTKECFCNLGQPNFDEIEFNANNSKMKIVCGSCHSVICWWPISTEPIVSIAAYGTKKSLAIPTATVDRNIQ
jgi:hypothetical protein